ncbi:hypothetical protein N330_09380, partial [Leptosomus discolor]
APIEFLLLAQGHVREDLESMYCMNLSEHLESVHKSIQLLNEAVKKPQVDDGGSWLNNL